MTLVLLYNQYDIEPAPDHVGAAYMGRGRVEPWSIVRTALSGSKGAKAVLHVRTSIQTVHRGRVSLELARTAAAAPKNTRQPFTVMGTRDVSPGRGGLIFNLGRVGTATPRNGLIRGVRA